MPDIINSGQIVQKPPTTIDPRFPLPPGVIGVRTQDRDESDVYSTAELEGSSTYGGTIDPGEVIFEDGAEDPRTRGLLAPQYITLVSQMSRTGPDGRQVVDVIIDVAEVAGATDYDVRISKPELED